MTTTAPNRTEVRSDFRTAAAQLRTNAGLDDHDAVAAVVPEAEIGAAARRLRASNSWNTSLITRGQSDGARILVGDSSAAAVAPVDPRQAAAEADRMRRHQQLAARGATLLAQIEAEQAASAPPPVVPPRSLFSR